MTPLDWQDSWSAVAYDLGWAPVPLRIGLLNTDKGIRFAVLFEEPLNSTEARIGIFVPGQDVAFATNAARFAERRARGEDQ
ncbi:hypothetical protein ABZ215_38620 [Amycolatopsis sp. NPDC006131]|uniref:hypothetical protein n=1 Tax=Amycolatopsis sp. NPDC006131 TaxID=3156731 RepID=UPI0033B51214